MLLSCHITNIFLIFRAAGRKIWACRLCNGRPSGRGAWLFFVRLLTCVMFLFVAVRIHYDFSYLILRQHTSPFHTWNLTFHCETNEHTYFAKLNWTDNEHVCQCPFPLLRCGSQPTIKLHSAGSQLVNIIRFYDPNLFFLFTKCKTKLTVRYFLRFMKLMHSWLIRVKVRVRVGFYILATQRRHWELIQCWNVPRTFRSNY